MRKLYTANGFVIHKRSLLTLLCIWFLVAIGSIVIRIYDFPYSQQHILLLIPIICLFLITLYIGYMIKNTQIKLEIRDDGITYEGGKKSGLRFYRFTSFAPWDSVKSIAMLDDKKGPIIVETADSKFIYWNTLMLKENNEILNEISKMIKTN